MDLGERIIDCDGNEHLVGYKFEEDGCSYIITIERRILKKDINNKYIECFENNIDKKIYNKIKDMLEMPECFDVIY